jgi:hypothetical protein
MQLTFILLLSSQKNQERVCTNINSYKVMASSKDFSGNVERKARERNLPTVNLIKNHVTHNILEMFIKATAICFGMKIVEHLEHNRILFVTKI